MASIVQHARTLRLAYLFTTSFLFIGAMASTTMQFNSVPDPRLCILLLVGNVVVAFSLLFRFFTSAKRDTTRNDTALVGGACVFALVQVVALSVASPNFIVTNRFNLPRGPSVAHIIFSYLALLFTSCFFLFFRPKAVSADIEKLEHGDENEEEDCVAAVILNGVRNLSKKSSNGDLSDAGSLRSKLSMPKIHISAPMWVPSPNPILPRRILKLSRPTAVEKDDDHETATQTSISTTSSHPIADRFMSVEEEEVHREESRSNETTPRNAPVYIPQPLNKPTRLLTVPVDVENRGTAFSAESAYSRDTEYIRPTKSVVDRLSTGAFAYLGWRNGKI